MPKNSRQQKDWKETSYQIPYSQTSLALHPPKLLRLEKLPFFQTRTKTKKRHNKKNKQYFNRAKNLQGLAPPTQRREHHGTCKPNDNGVVSKKY